MKTNSIKKLIVLLAFCLPTVAWAQDYHFSQFDALVPGYQPALTGITREYQYRAASQYRNQWRPLSNRPFTSFALSYDMPLNKRWGVGGYFVNFDGAKVYNSMDMVVSAAYQITDPSQREHLLTVGLQAGIIYKNVTDRDLLFENQYDNGQFNSALPTGEDFEKFNKLSPEFNMGLYYEWTDRGNKFHPYLGVSIFHLSSPKEALLQNAEETRLERRYMFNPGCKFEVNDQLDIDVKGMYQFQGKAKELLVGASGAYLIKDTKTKVNLGVAYRNQDAVSVMTGVTYEDLMFAINYDITTSTLESFNGGRGALELTLVYRPNKRR